MTFCSIERVVMILIEDLTVVSQREIAPRIFEMVLKGEMVADMQRLDQVLRELQPVLKTLNDKSNALVFEAKDKKDPQPKGAK